MRGRPAAPTRRVGAASLVGQEELPASAMRPFGGDLLEFWIGCEPVTFDVTARLIPDETLVGVHLVAHLVVVHHLGFQRRAIFVADYDDVAASLHVAGAPVMSPLAGGQRRRRS